MAILGLALALLWPPLFYRCWRWEVLPDRVLIQRSVIWRSRSLIPRVRVQHVDTRTSPLQRWLGFSSLIIYTVGTRGADAEIPGLDCPIFSGNWVGPTNWPAGPTPPSLPTSDTLQRPTSIESSSTPYIRPRFASASAASTSGAATPRRRSTTAASWSISRRTPIPSYSSGSRRHAGR